jgi:hypothetical protein
MALVRQMKLPVKKMLSNLERLVVDEKRIAVEDCKKPIHMFDLNDF